MKSFMFAIVIFMIFISIPFIISLKECEFIFQIVIDVYRNSTSCFDAMMMYVGYFCLCGLITGFFVWFSNELGIIKW